MRASEFINENAKISKRHQIATKGLHVFNDVDNWASDYLLNRLMMAAGSTDGKIVPKLDALSWIGKSKSAHPYSKEENDKLKMAYKALGAQWIDVNNGDLNSEELESTNTQSTLKPFKGYKKK
jgi:hypothetical protein